MEGRELVSIFFFFSYLMECRMNTSRREGDVHVGAGGGGEVMRYCCTIIFCFACDNRWKLALIVPF